MKIVPWAQLPSAMQKEAVRPYYDILSQKRLQLAAKRLFDVVMAGFLLMILSPLLLLLGLSIRLGSQGPALFRQERVTQYGRRFRILKFRTMISNAEQLGAQVTAGRDTRITKLGTKLRDSRLDELPQLINILKGDMSFVGVRPEVPRYVAFYTDEMLATLLLPAGVTSKTSILYKDEGDLLERVDDLEKAYIESVLPDKMKYNLQGLMEFSCKQDIKIMMQTIRAMVLKNEMKTTESQGV